MGTIVAMNITVTELAEKIEGVVIGEGERIIDSAAGLAEAGPNQVSFLSNPKYTKRLAQTRAGAVIVPSDVKDAPTTLIRAEDSYYAFRQAMILLHGFREHPTVGIDPRAVIGEKVQFGRDVTILHGVTIGAGAVIGDRTVIYPGCWIGPRVKIGADCRLYPNVVIYEDCVLGDRVSLHANTTIGQDGFGYATHRGLHHKIPQVGVVMIEDDVELGANCAVDRGTVGRTVIGQGTKMSDLIAIGHGTRIGSHCLVVAQAGFAGSVETGDYCVFGGQAGIAGHLKIGSQTRVAAQAGVTHDLPAQAEVMGAPAEPADKARRAYPLIKTLPDLRKRIRKLEKEMEKRR